MKNLTCNELCKIIEKTLGPGQACACCMELMTEILKYFKIEVIESEKNYVLQNVHAEYVGNDILFWAKDAHGYCCDLDNAEIFTIEEAKKILNRAEKGKFKLWKKSDLATIAKRHIDHQYLGQIEESEG